MKQIPLLQGKALLIELPEGLGEYNMFLWDAYYDVTGDFHEVPSLASTHKDPDKTRILLPEGNWRIIGMLSEVTEEQAAHLVKFVGHPWCAYKDYTTDKNWFNTALESLESAILAERYTFINPTPKPDCDCITEYDREGCDQECWKYINAQSRVLCRERCLLLGRESN